MYPEGEYFVEECKIRGKKCGNMQILPMFAIVYRFKNLDVDLNSGTCKGSIGEDEWERASGALADAAAEWIAYEASPTV